MGQSKNQMKIGHRQQFRFSLVQPLLFCHGLTFGAVTVSAGIVGNLGMVATITKFNMTTLGSRAAGNDLVDDTNLLVGS